MGKATSKPSVGMPSDWDDQEGWDQYYSTYPAAEKPTIGFSDLLQLMGVPASAKRLLDQGKSKVWFPGCGVSVIPSVYAALGLQVWASDSSTKAIQIQKSRPPLMEWLPDALSQSRLNEFSNPDMYRQGELHLCVHDFRVTFEENNFDCIFNIKAFQGLPAASMDKAARVHWEALKPGGEATFYTMNVQGHARTKIEESLLRAGFYIPYHAIEKWYRQELNATGIDYVFILGSPMVRRNFGGWIGELIQKRNQKRLNQFRAKYERRIAEAGPQTEATLTDGVSKTAWVSYSTG